MFDFINKINLPVMLNIGLPLICLVILLIYIFFSLRIKSKLLQLMSKAEMEAGKKELYSTRMIEVVNRLQDSDWDDRMIYVIASALEKIPVFKLIPKSMSIKLLNMLVQKIFDQTRDLVNAVFETRSARNNIIEENKDMIPEIISEVSKIVLENEIKDMVDNKIEDVVETINEKKEEIENKIEEKVEDIIDNLPEILEKEKLEKEFTSLFVR